MIHSALPRMRGAAIVEFAFAVTILLALLIAILDLARLLAQWNLAAEATRLGARLAVVCDPGDPDVKARMRAMMLAPAMPDAELSVTYYPPNCDATTCTSVTVAVNGYRVGNLLPHLGWLLPTDWGSMPEFSLPVVPPFTTTLTRESLQSSSGGGQVNPVCQPLKP